MILSDLALSEDDVRASVVLPWLRARGFSANEVSVEVGFEIRLGRSVYRVGDATPAPTVARPRADLLIRNADGRNLMVVEVKTPDDPMDESARDQGLSYARLLVRGGIAPLLLVTNGWESQLFDVLSGARIDELALNPGDPRLRGELPIGFDDLTLRTEALAMFVSLSAANLGAFCQTPGASRMKPLRGTEVGGGKKYLPCCYVVREAAESALAHRLDTERRPVVILTGPPQMGKTNLLCHAAERRLADGRPCLFYTALGLESGLLASIADDMLWSFGGGSDGASAVVSRLRRLLRRVGERLVLFVDGWNEASHELARTIDRDSRRLADESIQLVVSATRSASRRLLLDDVGDPGVLAEAASIPSRGAQLLELGGEPPPDWSVVTLEEYSPDERTRAYQTYAKAFGVVVPTHCVQTSDPLRLRVAMEASMGGTLPESLDEPQLLRASIDRKCQRSRLSYESTVTYLSALATRLWEFETPVTRELLMQSVGMPAVADLPPGLAEAALFALGSDQSGATVVDFYSHRERDYAIAYLARDWPRTLAAEDADAEFSRAAHSSAARDALAWFLRQPAHRDQLNTALPLRRHADATIRRLLVVAVCDVTREAEDVDDAWIKAISEEGAFDSNMLVRVEAARLLVLRYGAQTDGRATENMDEGDASEALADALSPSPAILASFLEIDEEYPLEQGAVGGLVIRALQRLNESSNSFIAALTAVLSIPKRELAAAKAFGAVAPREFLRCITDPSTRLSDESRGRLDCGLLLAADTLGDEYFGDMCPGYLSSFEGDPERLREEYEALSDVLRPVVEGFAGRRGGESLREFWVDVHHGATRMLKADSRADATDLPPPPPAPTDPRQTSLDFPALDD